MPNGALAVASRINMTIYIDSCALSREHDDQTDVRIRGEAAAVAQILEMDVELLSSDMLVDEFEAIRDDDKRKSLLNLLTAFDEHVPVTPGIVARGRELAALGFGSKDAIHLACAEFARADWFLTTDDRLIRCARRHREILKVKVDNPAAWVLRSDQQ